MRAFSGLRALGSMVFIGLLVLRVMGSKGSEALGGLALGLEGSFMRLGGLMLGCIGLIGCIM